MRPARELTLAFVTLLSIQLLTSFGAIALLGRMSPAIQRILEENVASLEAVDELLALLAIPARELNTTEKRVRYGEALARARRSVTSAKEVPLLDRVEANAGAALAGEPRALARSIDALDRLGRVNREAMRAADEEAQQLGTAGAWAAVFLGFSGFLASVIAIRRLGRVLVTPIEEIVGVLDAHRSGDLHRRCVPTETSEELKRTLATINELLDSQEIATLDEQRVSSRSNR